MSNLGDILFGGEGGASFSSSSRSSPWTPNNPTTKKQSVPEATVTVGTVGPDDEEASYIENIGTFADYMVNCHYEKNKHVYMMPLTSPKGFQGDSVAFVQLANPTLMLVADWTAFKLNEVPDIPNPDPVSLGSPWIHLHSQFTPAMITVGTDGSTPLYRISGTYYYGHKRPDEISIKDLRFPMPPWLEPLDFSRKVPDNVLNSNLVLLD